MGLNLIKRVIDALRLPRPSEGPAFSRLADRTPAPRADYVELRLARLVPSAPRQELEAVAAEMLRIIAREKEVSRNEGWQKGRDYARSMEANLQPGRDR